MNTNFSVLLDKSTQFNEEKVKILDKLVHLFYNSPQNLNMNEANQILTELQQDPDFWFNADLILEHSKDNNTKFIALKSLEATIQNRWKIMPKDQKDAIKSYVVNMIVDLGAKLADSSYHSLISKADSILVEIIKQEWGNGMEGFIKDIVDSSKKNQDICENSLYLLKMLSEEIFDYSKHSMSSTQTRELKESMQKDFQMIFDLCHFVIKSYLDNSSQVRLSLIEGCLETLYAFLSWIPLAYIFMTELIDNLIQLFEHKDLKNQSLKCLIEIVILPVGDGNDDETSQIKEKIFKLYTSFIYKLGNFVPYDISLAQERGKMEKNNAQNLGMFDEFCQQLALFLSGFFKTHLEWLEPLANDNTNLEQVNIMESIKKGFGYLVHLSELPEQTFKICVDFWQEFTDSLLKRNSGQKQNGFSSEPLLLLNNNKNNDTNTQNSVYNLALVQIRSIMITRMAKPLEVLLVIDETGRPVKQQLQNTENNSLYEVMKSLLVNLTKLDWSNMRDIMLNKLEKQLDGTEWSFDNLNSLSWAIGSISGTVTPSEEKNFLIITIRNLLTLCEQKKGKENKAVVASDIMYVVGQYPRFLKSNWNFLKTVVKKLFEFMHETYPGVMEMAVNTFLRISESCKEEFVIYHNKTEDIHGRHQINETEPYIDELIRKIPQEVNLLENEHKYVFYEAVGHMISCEKDFDRKNYLIEQTLADFWETWETMLREIEMNIDNLKNEKFVENFNFIIQIHERLTFAIGNDFYKGLAKIYMDVLKLYILYSNLITAEIESNGTKVVGHYHIKKVRALKRQILTLVQTFVEKSTDHKLLVEDFIPPLSDVIEDFSSSVADAKEPEVISLFTTITEKLKEDLVDTVPKILELIFNSTLDMITTDFNSFHDHRVNLFKFILAITNHCFGALFKIPPQQFKNVIDCVIWAIKHELPLIFEVGLEAMITILTNVVKSQDIANDFFEVYFIDLLNDIIFVLTDDLHKSGYKQQAKIFSILLGAVYNDFLTVKLSQDQGDRSNKEFIYDKLLAMLSESFQTLSKNQTANYLQSLFKSCNEYNDFKKILRDYLIDLKSYDPEAIEEMQKNNNGNNNQGANNLIE